jgi:hypothetical protein
MPENNTNTEKTNAAKFKIWMRYLIFAGIVLIIIGLVYDFIYVGIPYQDAPAELLKKYTIDSIISEVITRSGVLLLVFGLFGVIASKWIGRKTR